MLGAGSSWAENVKVFSKGFGTPASNGAYNTSTGVYSSSSSSNNLMTLMEFSSGTLSSYSQLTITLTNFTFNSGNEGGHARVRFDAGSSNVTEKNISAAGTYTFIFGTGTDEGTTFYINDVSTVTKITFGGASVNNQSGCKTTILNTGVYLTHNSQTGNSEGALEISDASGISTLNSLLAVGGVNVEIQNDLELGSTMIGSSSAPYSGTFNGNGKILSFTYTTGSGDRIAPFNYIKNATIKNLLTTGSISAGNVCAGIVGDALGSNTISNSGSDMSLTSTERVGGLVGRCAETDASIVFSYCIFNGSMTTSNSNNYANGFVGYNTQSVTTNYCLVAPTSIKYNTSTNGGNNVICGTTGPTANNTYYYCATDVSFTNANSATQVTDDMFSGKLAYTLNTNNTGTLFFGQENLNKSNVKLPVLTTDATKKVYKMAINNINANYQPYVNRSGAMPNLAKYGITGLSDQGTLANRTPLASVPSNYEGGTMYTLTNMYNLTVGDSKAATLVLPFEATIPDNIKAYTLTYTSGENLNATLIETETIPSNTPVLINATTKGDYVFKVKDFSSPSNTTLSNWNSSTVTSGQLTGVYFDLNQTSSAPNPVYYVPANSYVLQNGASGLGFYKVNEANTIKITSFRAYLTPQTGVSPAPMLSIDYGNNTTGITDLKKSTVEDDVIYNLNGVRVTNPSKGLYIVNGKKVVIK